MAKISKEAKAMAEKMGANAYLNGLPVVPSACPEFSSFLRDFPIGGGAVEVMKAFQSGWAKEMCRATVSGN